MEMKIKSVLLLFVMFLVAVTVVNVSFAATDIVKTDKYSLSNELNFKGIGSDLNIKLFAKSNDLKSENDNK